MKKTLILFFVFCPAWALADHVLEVLRSQITLSQTVSTLEKAIRQEELYLTHLQACDFELKFKIPPAHCYLVMKIQTRLRALSQGKGFSQSKLDSLCQIYVQKSEVILMLKAKLQEIHGISPVCEKALKERVEDLEYQNLNQFSKNSDIY